MKQRKTIKHKQFSIEEKNQIVLLYFDHHMGASNIFKEYNIVNKSVFWVWVNQYKEFGTCIDRRGKGTKKEFPNKGRPKKYVENLEELNKEQLIEKVRMYQDIKKSLVYLMKQQSNNTIK
jgi:transposase-like protein